MGLIVAPVPVGARLVDSVGLTPALITKLAPYVDGFIAYLGVNFTDAAIAAASAAGKGMIPVNESRDTDWIPSAALGAQDADVSVMRLRALQVPFAGLYDWIDVEGCGANPTAYIDAAAAGIVSATRKAGGYVGAGALLSGAQWYARPNLTGYWHSLSRGIPEPQCGFQLVQLYDTTSLEGLDVDYNFAQRDFNGRQATWLFPS